MSSNRSLSRRRFLVSAAAAGAVVLAGCGRDRVRSTTLVDFLGEDRQSGDPLWSPEARAYVAEFPARLLPAAKAAYTDDQYASVALGLAALSIVCPKDKAEVGYCRDDRAYACPVCKSTYNAVGELVGGPAARGLDRFSVSKDANGGLVIDRARSVDGPPAGVAVLQGSDEPGVRCSGAALRLPTASAPAA